uniref:Uncharacterized protein LOC104216311 n=1 Tax=Nicotiana sylvestris TaxID=4096 RepID=A0A1U7V9B4_NICSY|nr:PREDICTED: uncharacterized protein LOC104216311 [Nicotiana sylvestris]
MAETTTRSTTGLPHHAKTSTGETPYSLVYGTDAVIHVEVGEPSLRYSNESVPNNDKNRIQDLDEVEERRDMAHMRIVAQKQQTKRYYNKKAKIRPLKVGDYVLKAKTQATKDQKKENWDPTGTSHIKSQRQQGKGHSN